MRRKTPPSWDRFFPPKGNNAIRIVAEKAEKNSNIYELFRALTARMK